MYPRWIFPILLVAALGGCVTSSTSSKESVEWERSIDRENYRLCVLAYSKSPAYMVHKGHTERDHKWPAYIKSDLAWNNCKQILREYWIQY